MANFINTIDILGDETVAGMIVDRSITAFNDDILTDVGMYAFSNCRALTSVSLLSVTKIRAKVFYDCSNLISVTLPAAPPTLANTDAFSGIKSTCVFHIPTGSLSAYQNATNWSTLTGKYTFTEDA